MIVPRRASLRNVLVPPRQLIGQRLVEIDALRVDARRRRWRRRGALVRLVRLDRRRLTAAAAAAVFRPLVAHEHVLLVVHVVVRRL